MAILVPVTSKLGTYMTSARRHGLGYRLASTVTTVLDWDSVTQVVSSLSTPADLTLDP
jgi:hypothetical protein